MERKKKWAISLYTAQCIFILMHCVGLYNNFVLGLYDQYDQKSLNLTILYLISLFVVDIMLVLHRNTATIKWFYNYWRIVLILGMTEALFYFVKALSPAIWISFVPYTLMTPYVPMSGILYIVDNHNFFMAVVFVTSTIHFIYLFCLKRFQKS